MNAAMIASVAAGGAVGAVTRYLVVVALGQLVGTGFPWGTFAVNVVGSFALGVFAGASAHFWSPSPEVRTFLAVGCLGAFTTFSAFSLDVVHLVENERLGLALAYVVGSVAFSVGALLLGLRALRVFVT